MHIEFIEKKVRLNLLVQPSFAVCLLTLKNVNKLVIKYIRKTRSYQVDQRKFVIFCGVPEETEIKYYLIRPFGFLMYRRKPPPSCNGIVGCTGIDFWTHTKEFSDSNLTLIETDLAHTSWTWIFLWVSCVVRVQ